MDKEMNAKAMARWLMAANLLCLTVMFGMYVFYPHYATDDYNNYYCSMELGGVHAYVSMRPIVGIVWWILAKLGINFVRDQVFFGILLLFPPSVQNVSEACSESVLPAPLLPDCLQ